MRLRLLLSQSVLTIIMKQIKTRMENEYINTMLISASKVKSYGLLNLNVDDSVVSSAIRIAQNVYLVDVIGVDLVHRLQQLVYNKIKGQPDTIDDSGNTAYKTLLDEYVTDVLAYKTASETVVPNTLKQRNFGTVQNADTNVRDASVSDARYLRDYLETSFNHYLNRMSEFLCENKGAFPEYTFDCGCEPNVKYGNIGLWLGD